MLPLRRLKLAQGEEGAVGEMESLLRTLRMGSLGRQLAAQGLTVRTLYERSREAGGLARCGVPEEAEAKIKALLDREFGEPPCVLLWLNNAGELLAREIQFQADAAAAGLDAAAGSGGA